MKKVVSLALLIFFVIISSAQIQNKTIFHSEDIQSQEWGSEFVFQTTVWTQDSIYPGDISCFVNLKFPDQSIVTYQLDALTGKANSKQNYACSLILTDFGLYQANYWIKTQDGILQTNFKTHKFRVFSATQ